MFKITALAAMLTKIQNGAFVYHNMLKLRTKVINPSDIFCLHSATITRLQNNIKLLIWPLYPPYYLKFKMAPCLP